ncbi:MAG: cupin fold metalloprotein, WbuC family [Chloroflexia bacterium]|nr:cupin fold metalloprotein, WbuC family [Chloroflexia bacterium]
MVHRHLHPVKSETILVISGSLLFVEFDVNGQLLRHTLLQPGTETFGIDVAPHIYHTCVALRPDTLLFELSQHVSGISSSVDILLGQGGESRD